MRRPAVFVPILVAALAVMPSAAPSPADDASIVHVLNRIGYGPRPADVERMRQLGIQEYIQQQLHPERIADEGMQARLDGMTTLTLSTSELLERYQQPNAQARRARQQAAANNPSGSPPERPMRDPNMQPPNLPLVELSEQKLLRAIYSDRQLEQVLTDFWFNHFNVDARKGPVRMMLTEYEREAIRPHVLGRFRDLLGATAKSPAMLFYLDNWMSSDPNADMNAQRRAQRNPLRPQRPQQPQRPLPPAPPANAQRGGLNENYARELMELHTVGVDGGYTQKDVTEVARAFTGWTIRNPRVRGDFVFEPRIHDDQEKVVLGHKIRGGGLKDGEQVLDILAEHPSTARFISTKLARRFVSDTPPSALVERMSARFTATRGDLREVLRMLLTSPEFLAPALYSTKTKTPFEFVVSAVRATDAPLNDVRPLVRSLQELGMPLYQCQPPTGYKDTADAWVNTGALVGRMNFAQSLASAPSFGVRSDRDRSTFDASTNARTKSAKAPERGTADVDPLVGLTVSDATRSTIARATTPQQGLALMLGSPEFQKR
jgi:uncharacterized protein (DUF1800 family)